MWHMGDNPGIRMSAEIVRAAFSSAGIVLADGADLWAEYQAQVAAGTIAAIDGLSIPKTASTIPAVYDYVFLHGV
jgi:hypothetical protein